MSQKSPQNAPHSSLRQIAATAGVSAMTVSRVLRNLPHVKPDVARRVRDAAERAGYTQDPAMSKLMVQLRLRKKTRYHASIAALTTIPAEIEPHPPRFVREGARARAAELGYRLELFRLKSAGVRNDALQRTLANRGIDGVLLLQMVAPSAVDALLDWEKFSVVAATSSIASPDFMRVGADYYHNARVLCAELAARGYHRAGFVGTPTFGVRTNDAVVSAIAAMTAPPGAPPPRPLVLTARKINRADFRAWFAREKPDAIIVCAEEFVPRIRRELGMLRRTKLPVLCTSVDPKNPVCAGIDECHSLIGGRAIDVLTGMINRNEKNQRATHVRTLIEGRWCGNP